MTKPIRVEVRDARLRHPSFVWREPRYTVAPIESHWLDAGEAHILVLANGDETFHLAFLPNAGPWGLGRTSADLGTRLPVYPSGGSRAMPNLRSGRLHAE